MIASDPPVLVADVGGTNTRVALARGHTLVAGSTMRFRNAEHAGLASVLRAYLDQQKAQPDRAAVALAGPVRGTRAEMTNLGWSVDAEALAGELGLREIALLNDLQAQGHALAHLPESHLRRIRAGQPEAAGARLVVGLGTGVNAAPVYASGAGHIVPAAEAGHIHLPLHDALDYRLAEWLIKQRGFASVEDVLAGSGLERLYVFHAQEANSGRSLDAGAIMAAMDEGDALARAVGRHYVRLLAQVMADLALITLPKGGIYLIGGVARAFAPWLDRFGFEAAFTDMGRFSELVAAFPVAMVEDDYAALTGCAAYLEAR